MNRFFFSSLGANGVINLYSSDGTAGGTTPIYLPGFEGFDQPPDAGPSFTIFDNSLFFLANGIDSRSSATTRIYSTDGSETGGAGTQITGSGGIALPDGLWTVGNALLTSGPSEDGPAGIWALASGTGFNEIEIGVGTNNLVVSHGIGFFNANVNTSNTTGLWRTDGTAAGTYSITPAAVTLNPINFASVGNDDTVFQDNTSTGADLWVTNGTAAGTHQITARGLGAGGADSAIASTGNRAIFTETDSAGNFGAWSTDGTASGTVELLAIGANYQMTTPPQGYASFGSKVAFVTGESLYATDGTKAGTVSISSTNVFSFAVAGTKLFFVKAVSPGDEGLFVSDGTVAGTNQVPIAGLDGNGIASVLTSLGDGVVFQGEDLTGQTGTFFSDGTTGGTAEEALPTDATNFAALPSSTTSSGVVTLPGGAQSYNAPAGTTVQAGSGSDTITATAGQVTVNGSSGRLVFFGGTGASSVNGAGGSTTIFGGSGGGDYTAGMAGRSILISQGASGANTTLTGAGYGDRIFGAAAGTDTLSLGSGKGTIVGGGGPTSITGGASASVIFGGAGSTSITGGAAGGDTIVGTSGFLGVTAQGGDAVFGGSASIGVTGSLRGADSVIGGTGALNVFGQGGNMLVVGSTTSSNIFTGDGASLIFIGAGSTSVTGGSGGMQVVLGSGGGTLLEGSGPALYDAINGSAGGTDVISGFKVNADAIDLYGYGTTGYTLATSGGSTTINVSDGTKIELLGVANPGHSIVG